jgi:hypothetical protein
MEQCFWCDATAERQGPSNEPICKNCFWRMYQIWYVNMGKHDDFAADPTLNKGHMYYQRHDCTVWLRDMKQPARAWCLCGREIRLACSNEIAKDPLAFVAEQIAEIMQTCGGAL